MESRPLQRRSAAEQSGQKRSALSISVLIPTSRSSKRTVYFVRRVTSGSACGPTRRTARYLGTLTGRAAWPRSRAYPICVRTFTSEVLCPSAPPTRKNVNTGDQRSNAFANDPYVRKFDAERVLCKLCETWLSLGTNDTPQAVQTWMDHKLKCLQTKNASSSNAGPSTRYIICFVFLR